MMNDYSKFIAYSRYSRYNDIHKRRETWEETVARYFDFMEEHLKENNGYELDKPIRVRLEKAVLDLAVMPSMRCLATAGAALKRDNTAGYNCSYLPINHPRAFDELFYILLCGTGVGYSVERQYIQDLPEVNEHFEKSGTVITVEDSKAGWARSLRELIAMLYVGQIPSWDLSKVRPAGARLKTFGGRASGPGPLNDLLNYTVGVFRNAAGRRLNSLECHDLCCKIASVVVVGGVRRSAMISLSNLSDPRMRDAKEGSWATQHPDRSFANNSVAYTERPDMGAFMEEWRALYKSGSGERGIFYRKAAQEKALENGRRESGDFGCNPCGEIILRPFQFCNLSEVVVRASDTEQTLKDKVELATILGTMQATLTNFKYLRAIWKRNTEEERLLGVSLTGICDSPLLYDAPTTLLNNLRKVAIDTNKEWSEKLGINQSVAITTVKPSGTVSQLVNAASGIHPRYARYYIRRVRADIKDPLTAFMQDQGIPSEPCAYKPESTVVFSFPIKADEGTTVFRESMDAIEHLDTWLVYRQQWCEHNPSVTIQVKPDEWMEVGAWVYKHFDQLTGVAFLPYDSGSYTQAPYEEITEEQYKELDSKMPTGVDWEKLVEFEGDDNTGSSREFACTGDSCELVDLNVL